MAGFFALAQSLPNSPNPRTAPALSAPWRPQIRDAIDRLKPDLVALDPFVKTHALEENDAGDMDFVCTLLARLAIEKNIAVDVPHHVHKGQITPGDADSGRGSSGIKDAGRLVYTLCAMSGEEAGGFNISLMDRCAYVRLDAAKINIAARPADAVWFKLVSVAIGNGTEDYPNGDHIQVAVPWSASKAFDGLNAALINTILSDFAKGLDTGQRYSNAPNAGEEREAWRVVLKHCPDKSEACCRQIVHAWLRSGLLYPKKYDDPIQRRERSGLFVNNEKRPS
jgi:hypothetical protein